jgi:hypothetical protein
LARGRFLDRVYYYILFQLRSVLSAGRTMMEMAVQRSSQGGGGHPGHPLAGTARIARAARGESFSTSPLAACTDERLIMTDSSRELRIRLLIC